MSSRVVLTAGFGGLLILMASAGFDGIRALGQIQSANDEMRASYEAAARHPTAYYGQLARARKKVGPRQGEAPPNPDPRLKILRIRVHPWLCLARITG